MKLQIPQRWSNFMCTQALYFLMLGHIIIVDDFGFTRNAYSIEYYRVDQHTKLPLKWMAMESILDGYFNKKTDMVL